MKASEVIARLTELVEKHGDARVLYCSYSADYFGEDVGFIDPYDKNGNDPDDDRYLGQVAEFFIR